MAVSPRRRRIASGRRLGYRAGERDATSERREAAALIALVRRGDRPWHHYAQLAETAGRALAILEGRWVDPDEDEPLVLFPERDDPGAVDLDATCREIEAWAAEGMRLVTVLDDDYPANLRSIHNRPPFLFVRGELRPEDERSVAVVGTRRPSTRGHDAAARSRRASSRRDTRPRAASRRGRGRSQSSSAFCWNMENLTFVVPIGSRPAAPRLHGRLETTRPEPPEPLHGRGGEELAGTRGSRAGGTWKT